MEEYKHNIFYNPEPVVKFLDEFKKEVQDKAYEYILEEKYVKSSQREPTGKTLEWILDHCKKSSDVIILHVMPNFGNKECFQVVFHATPKGDGWYFAFFNLELVHKDYFVNKYNLKIL